MKPLIASSKIALALAALLSVSAAPLSFAEESAEGGDCERRHHRGGMMKHHRGWMGGNPREMMERQLSADQIRTLVEARLIMKGNENLQVGDISSTQDGYRVTIVTQDNSLVKEMDLAQNGLPVKMYERMQRRMERHEARDE
ncbi:hypothetical protein HBA55_20040 [Pseudomaricurvus alkylphenolicus]|jgi:hypothetical protein|uniref:hypothetical protein n=1 Tax=Pseudomaricurvus alkylphenolicus TaxID=1306991 RepID=UPI001421CCA8|nr:hypothetical protein [Pseudomaricurvus alkylphenolicus]NIB41907.1 hypothetical protein [Pseudomaricurvus alkylphenolicus]